MSNRTDSRGPAEPSRASGARWKWVAAVGALGVVMAASATAFAFTRGSDSSSSLDSPGIAATQSACRQWHDDKLTSTGTLPDEGWCNGMGDWMYDQMSNGSMMGNTMGSQAMLEACQQWLDDDSTSTATVPDEGWCNGMGDWMYGQMANGSMMGTTIWGSPEAMLDACLQWTAASPGGDTTATAATSSATAWCEQMVTWMSQHMGNWNDWLAIGATQSACLRWLDDDSTSTGSVPDQGWCNGMGDWMYGQMANGSMMGTTMWGSPEAMLDACLWWTAASPGGDTTATSATAWCEQMVSWMSQHIGDWDDHMRNGRWNGMTNR